MQFSNEDNDNMANNRNDHDIPFKSDFGLDYWQNRFAAATPTIFPLRSPSKSSSCSVIDASITGHFLVPSSGVLLDHGIEPSTMLALAYSLVLKAHADSLDEVVFAQVHYPESITNMASFVQHVTLDFSQTTLFSLIYLQKNMSQLASQQAFGDVIPTEVASLFRTILCFHPNSTVENKWSIPGNVDYDLVFNIKPVSPEEIGVEIEYASKAITEPEVKAFLDHFGAAVENILHNLTSPLSEISLITPQEQQRLIREIYPVHTTSLSQADNVTQLIEEQVRKTPQKIALQFDQDEFVTYDQLNSLANNVGHILISSGVKRGDLVGIYMDKSCEMFIAILGIHKAGGGYVPLDPNHPPERIQTILMIANINIVLTHGRVQSHLDAEKSIKVLKIDMRDLSSAIKPDVCVSRGDISHVLFTSGSTGVPKGVVLTHGSVVESCLGSREVIGSLEGQRVLQFSNYTFDLCVWDWCCTLMSGGTLCIVPKYKLLDDIDGVARNLDITYLGTTPTVARLITSEQVSSLQMLVLGGELLTPQVRNRWADEVTLINIYGPTEASTCVTAQTRVTMTTEFSNIGKPFGLNAIYVLDEHVRPVPLGCVGEVFIGGPQLARGYLGNPEQTAKTFIKDPFRPGFMYSSGDLVRISPIDHSIHYIGRRDTQVKIRGQRVEIEEIESVLKGASSVITNAAVVKVGVQGSESLAAFLEYPSETAAEITKMVHGDTHALVGSMRHATQQRLPTYMIPAIYVPLNRFPLTSSGKLDRKALTRLFYAHWEEIRNTHLNSKLLPELSSLETPRDELQTMLRSLWASILDCKEDLLSIDDNFFIVGGDSISAIRLASAARDNGIHLQTTDVIQNPTIRAMAQVAQTAIAENGDITLAEEAALSLLPKDSLLSAHDLLPRDVLDVYPCTALQTSFFAAGLLIDHAYIVRLMYDIPFGLDTTKIRQAFDDFIDHPNGAMFRTIFIFDNKTSRFLQVVTRPRWKRMEWTIIAIASEAELETAVRNYTFGRGCQKFEQGELLTRGCIIELNGAPRTLVWSLHHALGDHWSLNNAELDVADVYFQRPLPYRQHFKPMIKYLENVDRTAGIQFWQKHLLDAKPTHFPQSLWNAPRAVANTLTSRQVRMDHTLFSQKHGITAASLVTAAWSVVVAMHTNSTDVVFGQVVSGRNAPIKNIDTMTGITINTVARRVVLKFEASIIDTLLAIQRDQMEISKYEHIDLTELKSQGTPAAGLFKSLLNFANFPGDQKKSPKTITTAVEDSCLWTRRTGSYDGQDVPFGLTVIPITTDTFYVEASYHDETIAQAEVNVILDHFECALRFMIDHPDKLIDDVKLINDREMRLLIAQRESNGLAIKHYNPKASKFHVHDQHSVQSVSELIGLQVCKTPQRIALQYGHEAFLTYEQMDSLSNDLTGKLINKNVERGSLVALYMDKSIEMFLSILAIHKAGGAYVPLDPEFPMERINTIVRLSQTTMILTTGELHDQVASILAEAGVELMVVDYQQLSHATKPDICVNRHDISHVLFTSGSTGVPKGVVLTHGSVLESCLGSRELIGSLDGQRALQFSNYTFDPSVWDWSCTLISGGTLCFVPNKKLMDDLSGVARSLNITFLITVPTVARLITPKEAPFLQMLSVGGEVLNSEILDQWANEDEVTVINMYGPTEASTCVTAQTRVTPSTAFNNIGRPFGLNVVYILDERLRPVPLGCIGELYIGGPQLARGYLSNSEQTAKAFIEDPFRPGSIMYASGDLAQISPVDFSIHYLGRRDTQIKVHGTRMDIGEIEFVLKGATSVITNTAVVKVDVENERLIAFVECPSGSGADDIFIVHENVGALLASLRHAARQRLPTSMVPTVYVPLNRFPLSSSGKLDRQSLAAFFYTHHEEIKALRVGSIFSPALSSSEVPENEVQVTLRSLWASILICEEDSLSIDDNFFIVGGDSISAIRLAGAARTAGFHISVSDIIRNSTIRQMSQVIQSAIPDREYDDDETPSLTFDQMSPESLSLLKLVPSEFNSLLTDLIPKYNLSPSDVLDIYPSTALQSSFLIAGVMAPGAYIVANAWDLPPRTDVRKLQKAFDDFINHPNGMMLRTLFVPHPVKDEWLQTLIKPGKKHMEWKVVTVADEHELGMRVSEYQSKGGREPFGDGKLLTRGCIFELNGYARVLVWTLHHAVYDGWSLERMMSDIRYIYSGRPLPSRRSFKTMIKYLQHLDYTTDIEFWRRHLKNASPTFLVQGHSNPHRVTADNILSRNMRPLQFPSSIRRFGIMPSTLVTCAWAMVLSAHTSATDVVFGQVLAGRNAPIKDIESMTGIMINTIARRVLLNPRATILETLKNIQSDQLEITKHEAISFLKLESEEIPVSSMFDSILNFRNSGGIKHDCLADDNIFRNIKEGRGRLDYPLALDVEFGSPDRIVIHSFYASEFISEREINVILDHFECALHFISEHPDKLIHDVTLIDEVEMQLLFPQKQSMNLAINCYDYDPLSVQSVSRLIELQAGMAPQRIALQFGQDIFLTYREMNLLSNDLAGQLIKRGVKRGNLIALYMDKSIEMFLSILAVHKAGGGYVPLDPEFPAERINTIVHLSQTTMILTTAELHGQVASMLVEVGVDLMVVDSQQLSHATKPDVFVTRDDISHVLFTSGSTGVPKGVVLTHRSVLESCLGSQELIGSLDGQRVLQFSNYTFDPSVWDWGCALMSGGTLCFVSKQKLMDDLGGITRSFDINFLITIPTVARLITVEEAPFLQTLVVGGELLTSDIRNMWANEVNLINIYGPTEASICVTAQTRVTTSTELSNIGKPFGMNVIYVLDEHRRPVPLGCVGEVFIGGPQLASGYLGNPEQTAKTFIEDPFRPSSIMYASGDLVRISPVDYSIRYVGRRDRQIKIRGQRVEVGEIESVLKGASSVITNAAVVKVDVENERLIAFVECPSAGADDIFIVRENVGALLASLRHAAKQRLPTFMVPTAYVPLNRFPLGSSGKLDRQLLAAFFHIHHEEIKALRVDSILSPQLSLSGVPENEVQVTLRSLWASILICEDVSLSIDDNFFVVGGDSISAIRLAGAARTAGFHISVSDIIRNSTIRQMSQVIQSAIPDREYDDDEIPSLTLDRMSPTDLSILKFAQSEFDLLRFDLLAEYNLSSSDVLDIYPATALQTSFLLAGTMTPGAYIVANAWDLPPRTDVRKLQKAFDDFINHPNGMMLRTLFVPHPVKDEWLQTLIKPGKKHMEWKVVTVADEHELGMRVSEYQSKGGREPFGDGKLLTRGCIFELNGYARVLVWTLHHAVYDGWSLERMMSDIRCIYSSRPLPPRRSFKTMIKYLQHLNHTTGIEFWRRHLKNASPTFLVQGHSNPHRVTADNILSRDMRSLQSHSLIRAFGIMPSTLVTCAWAMVLSAHTSATDVVFGQVLAGRNAPIKDIESMTGIMINTVARRVLLDPRATILETLKNIQSDQLEITKHEAISLLKLESEEIPVSSMFDSILNFRSSRGTKHDCSADDDMFRTPREGCGRLDYPLVLDVEIGSPDKIVIHSFYASEFIAERETSTILDHFECALRFISEHPDKLIYDVTLIDEAEMQLLFPQTQSMDLAISIDDSYFSSVQNITQLLQQQVRRTPQQIALQFEHDVFLTYNQVDSLSNDLAHKLISKNVLHGTLVALYMDKSIEMFLSILAVHKAGAAFIPLDPEFPAERINTVVCLSQPTIVLTIGGFHDELASILVESGVSLMVVNLQQLSHSTKPDVRVSRDDISHVLFTSGSTGIPKGVVLTHGSVIESCLGSREVIGSLEGQRVLQFSNYTFDLCVWDWCCTLMSGGTLCIVPKYILLDDIGGIAKSLDITYLGTTPTVGRLIAPEQIQSLQTLVLGGELLTHEVLHHWADEVAVINIYGPTEASTCVTAQTRVTSSTALNNVGQAFGLNMIYVLDESLRPVPLGCVGELFIGGPQVARGYLGDPQQTSTVFIKDPFHPGSVMYASGDLVRINPDDRSIYYIGRRDTQVKIRGQRVEIGEIESVLKGASSVITNAAVVKVDGGTERLVAFLEYPSDIATKSIDIVHVDADTNNLQGLLRQVAQRRLPTYMIPALYVLLNRFPLTSSGKLDRKKLVEFFHTREKDIGDLYIDSTFSPELSSSEVPYNEVQVTLRSLWASTLDCKENSLSIDDDFFSVGGDSISVIRLAGAARTVGLSIFVTDIIQNPTIRQMSQVIQPAVSNSDYDDDDTSSLTLDMMSSEDLPLLKFAQGEFDSLRSDLLPKHNLSPSDILDIYPSTSLQTSFLIAGTMAPGAYVIANAWDIPPRTDVRNLQEAFHNFINHPNGMMLRTLFVFHPVRDTWLQVLIKPGRKHMEWKVVAVVDEDELDLRVSEYRLNEGKEPFSDGMLLTRGCIFELNGYARVLVWTLHHAVIDGWSLERMASDIRCIYLNRAPTPRRSFKPMIKYLQCLDYSREIEFWKEHLENASPTSLAQRRATTRRITTDATISREVQTIDFNLLIRRFGIMPSTLITCAWAVVLSAHCGSTDVVFGQVLAGRNAPIKNIDSMTGVMINTVARRVLLDLRATIIETLQRIQSDQLEISKHEAISLAQLESEGVAVSQMFDSILNFGNRRLNGMKHDCLGDDDIFGQPKEGWGKLDYPCVLNTELRAPDKFLICCLYASELISEQLINGILDHFECALRFMLHHPDKLIHEIELINEREMQILVSLTASGDLAKSDNQSSTESPEYRWQVRSIAQLITLQAGKTPQRIALQFGHDIFLTYKQMDLLSNDLARKLIKRDVKQGTLIAIYMDKSIEMFLSILAIHKAGGAYVPLDPEFPAERINTIVRLSQVAVILTTGELHDRLASMLVETGVDLMVIDSQQLSHATKPEVCIGRDGTSLVLFTSGSTGVPKGVVHTHGSVIESCLGSRELIGSLDGQRVLQFSNCTFDLSVWDWTCTLISGGTLCFVPNQQLMDDLGGVTRSLDITLLMTTPTVARLITPEEAPFLQTLLVGGEVLNLEVLDWWADEVTVINVYGPTEATCVTAQTRITPSTTLNDIGRPFGSNVIYILDERLRPVPLGCVGELYIGGPQLARGYLSNPEQTAKAFIEDPFRPDAIIYASGDLVQINPVDLSICYLGRRDTQIKIRGRRMEIGEIETILKGASSTILNIAVVKVDVGTERLVAFLEYPSSSGEDGIFIVHEDIGTLLASLNHAAKQRLPTFMIPTIYVPLNRFPLSSSGKLDRRSLTAFFHAHQEEIKVLRIDSMLSLELSSSEVPQNEVQVTLRSLWASILNCEEHSLSIDDNFISVGGDSILATRLASAARNAGFCLSVTDIIRNPTIHLMSQIIQSAVLNHDYDDDETPSLTFDEMFSEDVPLLKLAQGEFDSLRNDLLPKYNISPSDILDIYPSTALQTSFLIASMMVPGAYLVSSAWDLPPNTEILNLQKAFDSFINHPNGMMLRTLFIFHPVRNEWLQVLIRPGRKHMEWETITVVDEDDLDLRVSKYQLNGGRKPFGNGMLLTRGCIFELNGHARVLVWTLQHALMDDWSLKRMMSDIQCIYSNHPLPPRRSFKPMIKYLQCLDHDKGIEFWKRHLENVSPTPLIQGRATTRRITTDATIFREVQTIDFNLLIRRFGIMPSTLITCAWAVVLSAHCGSTDVVFGQVLAGRNAPIKDIDSMTGVMINTIARRVPLNPQATILETLKNVQSDQLEISKYEAISLAQLESEGVAVSRMFANILNFRNTRVNGTEHDCLGDDSIFGQPKEGWGKIDYPFVLDAELSSSDKILICSSYASELISEQHINGILDHFECALHFMLHRPDKLIHEIELINEWEMGLLVSLTTSMGLKLANGDTQSPRKPHDGRWLGQSVSQLIELQVGKTPQRIALQFGHDIFLTYKQMDLLSNDLARKLIKRDVKQGTLIAIYMDKSIEMFLSILAIHKAGGAYVPLDPEFPAERINTIVRLSQVAVILTTGELHNQVASMLIEAGAELIVVGSEQLSHATKPEVCINRDDTSHVLFTSGSTGIPKGVILTHGSVLESCLGSRELIGSLDGQRVLQFSNYTFDPSVWDWTCTLISGGTLCFVPNQQLMDDLGGVTRSLDITFVITTPTVVRLITPAEAPCLQTLSVGGELLTSEILDQWADEITVINMYGPTEASTCVTAQTRVTPSTPFNDIGGPFGSNVIYILDERLRPVPLGCVGELYIGGPQLARGYLSNPEQTAKAFIADPFRRDSIMYASGDLVQISPVDLSIRYLGRRDTQIKIHGRRMEIGEIESVLKGASSAITNVAVVKVDVGNECLVAFLEYPSSSGADDIFIVHEDAGNDNVLESLRHAVQKRLPTFMIPTVYVPLNRFPLSTSGKLDRRSLTAFFHAHQEEIKTLRVKFSSELSSSEIPHNEVHVILRSLWASILNCEEHSLSIDDDFILVGGDSISATRLASAARTVGLCLSVTDILRNPTIRQMCQIIQPAVPNQDYDDDETSSLTLDEMSPDDLPLLRFARDDLNSLRSRLLPYYGLSASDVLDVYPSTPTQTSFLSAGTTVYGAYVVSIPLDLPPQTDVLKLRKAFDDFIDHPNGMMLRTVFVFNPVKNEWLQTLIKPGRKHMEWKIVIVDDENELDLQVSEYQANEGREPFGNGKLLTRGCIFELNGYARVLVWTLHHAVYDGWSLERIMSDIRCVYSNKPLPLRRSFKPMIKYLQHHDHTSGIDFWRRHLENALPTLIFPSPTAPCVNAGIIVTRDVEIITCSTPTRRFGIMFSTLVTCAWSIVLSAYTSATDVVFGQVLAARSAPIKDIESMTGIMINVIARRVVFDHKATIIEALREIQRDQLEINGHEHISLPALESEGIPVYNMFNSVLNFRNQAFVKAIGHDKLAEDDLSFRIRKGAFGRNEYSMALDIDFRSDLLSIAAFSASELISESDMHIFLDNFEYALRFIMDYPEHSISGLITYIQAKSFYSKASTKHSQSYSSISRGS